MGAGKAEGPAMSKDCVEGTETGVDGVVTESSMNHSQTRHRREYDPCRPLRPSQITSRL